MAPARSAHDLRSACGHERLARGSVRHATWSATRRAALPALALVALLAALATRADAQLLRIDAGDLNGYPQPAPGWQLLSETKAPPNVALVPAALDTVHVASWFAGAGSVPFPSDVLSIDPDQSAELHRLSALVLADPAVLTIGGFAPNRVFRVKLLLGAPSPWMEIDDRTLAWVEQPTASRGVMVEIQQPGTSSPPVSWRAAARGLSCATAKLPASLAPATGGIVTLWLVARSDAGGSLRLRFSSEGDDPVLLNAVEVFAHEPLPIVYRRGAQGPLLGGSPQVAPFVAAFNAHDYEAAEAWALAQADPWLAGVALCHLVGWLDGSADDRASLAPLARARLQAAQPQHAGAAWLLDELASLERAFAHLDARGYLAQQLCTEEGGTGFLNPACAGQISQHVGLSTVNANAHVARRELEGLIAPVTGDTVLEDLLAWNAGALPDDAWEPSPLLFAALKQSAAALAGMNPFLSTSPGDPDSAAFVDAFRSVFLDFSGLGFAAADFPRDAELPLFAEYAASQAHPNGWQPGQLEALSEAQIAGSWWGPLATAPPAAGAPAAPPWAVAQRKLSHARRAVTRWWMRERLAGGELGGGQGDDVEALLQFFGDYAAWRGASDRFELDGLDALFRHALEETAFVANGYYAGSVADVEHSSEFTTNPFVAMRGAQGHTPRAARTGLAVGRHLVDGAGSEPFAAPTSIGRLHFKSFWFTTLGPGGGPAGTEFDSLLDGRAMAPAVATALHSPLPAAHPLRADLRAWAAAWRDDALDTSALAAGKPLGFFGPASWPGNTIGTGGFWYSEKSSRGDTSLLGGASWNYPAGLLLAAYRGTAAADRWTYLLPAVRIFRAVAAWEDAGKPGGSPGSPNWAAAQVAGNQGFGPMVVAHRPHLAADAQLGTLPDPVLGGATTYVDAALLARLKTWAETGFLGQTAALRYALAPALPCGPHSVKATQWVAEPVESGARYVRTVFPLLTRYVMHTDRLMLNYRGSGNELRDAFTSAAMAEGYPFEPLLGWRAGPGLGADADIAVLVNGRDAAGTAVSAFVHNFSAAPAVLELALEEGLPPGAWSIASGPATEACDDFPPLTVPVLAGVDKPGRGASVPLLLAPGLNLVKLQRLGPALVPLAGHDLAVDPPQLELGQISGSPALVARVRVANLGPQASPSRLFTLTIAGLMPDGSLLPFGPDPELLISQALSLPGLSQWSLAETEIAVSIPIAPALAALLESGVGVLLRAAIAPAADEADRLNNSQSRGWLPAQIPAAGG